MRVGQVALERRRLDAVDRQRREQQRIAAERLAVAADHHAAFALDALRPLPRASGGSSSSLHSAGIMPRVRGAAFFGVLRLAGARLRFAVVLLFVAMSILRGIACERAEYAAPGTALQRARRCICDADAAIRCLMFAPMLSSGGDRP